MDNIDSRLEDTGRAFLGAAWDRLLKERVVPPPDFHPYPQVGRDYFGGSVSSRAEYRALEEAIIASHPRFDTGLPLAEREFPAGLIFSFLETFIARLARERVEFSLGGPAAEQSLRDLVQAVHADECEVACCRIVSHLTTTDSQPVEFAGVRVEPVISEAADHDRLLLRIISAVIAEASSAYGRDRPYDFAPPESVVIARQRLEAVRSGQAAVAADRAVHAAGAAVAAGHQ